MKLLFDIKSTVLLALILSPILFFPIAGDLSIFVMGGKILAEGKIIYHDFVDLKPPGFFDFFVFLYYTFGTSEFAVRLYDFIFQLLTSVLLMNLMLKIGYDKFTSFSASIIYEILYVTMGYGLTINPESYVPLVLVSIYHLFLKKENKLKYIFIGLILGIIASFKFSLFIITIAFAIFLYMKNKDKYLINMSLLSIGFIFIFTLTFIPLLNPLAMDGFKNVLHFLSFYTKLPPLSFELVKNLIKGISTFFGDNLSLSIIILFGSGFAYSYRNLDSNSKKSDITIFMMINLFLLLASILIERKTIPYYFIRLFIPIIFFASIGLSLFYQEIKNSILNKKKFKIIMITCILCFGFIFSPITRYIKNTLPVKYYFSDKAKYNSFYQDLSSGNIRVSTLEVVDYIKSHASKNSKILVAGIGTNPINYYLNTNYSKFTQSSFFTSLVNIKAWQKDFVKEMQNADYLIIHYEDNHSIQNMHDWTTYEYIKQDSLLNSILESRYEFVKNIQPMNIYKLKQIK